MSRFQSSCLSWFLVLVLCSTAPCICAANDNSSVSISTTPAAPNVFPQNDSAGPQIVPSKTLISTKPDLSKPENANVKTKETNTNSTVNNNPSVTSNTSNAQSGNKTFHIQPRDGISATPNKNDTTATVTSSNITEKEKSTTPDSNKIDTEVEDLNNASEPYSNPNHIPPVPFNLSEGPAQGINKEIGLIDDGENTEDMLRNSTANAETFSDPGVPLVQGQLAAILAGVFVAISVIAYVGMLSWRRYLENRYGNRQMLINEDEFNNDFRHFSI